jgi:hypothetical protein
MSEPAVIRFDYEVCRIEDHRGEEMVSLGWGSPFPVEIDRIDEAPLLRPVNVLIELADGRR